MTINTGIFSKDYLSSYFLHRFTKDSPVPFLLAHTNVSLVLKDCQSHNTNATFMIATQLIYTCLFWPAHVKMVLITYALSC